MRPIPLDDEDWVEPYQKVVVSGPSGDLTDNDIRPVEAIVGPVNLAGEMVPAFHIKILLEEADLEEIKQGQVHFWLIMYGNRLQPFAIEMR